MANERDNGGHFRFEATLRPDEDHKEAETSWYRWNKEVKRWEFYGNEMPSWDELSEGAKDTLSRAYDLIFRGHYEKERSEAIVRGVDPKELPDPRGPRSRSSTTWTRRRSTKTAIRISGDPTGSSPPVTLPSNPDKLAALKADLEQKLLQIQELAGRARQDSNLRPSDS